MKTLEPLTTWDAYTDQTELDEEQLQVSRKSTVAHTPAPSARSSVDDGNIFARLREILPNYDMESIADRYIARQKLMRLQVAAAKRSAQMSTRLDSDEDQERLSDETDSLAILQIKSMSVGDDVEE